MANTMLKYTGSKIGKSICESDCETLVKEMEIQNFQAEQRLTLFRLHHPVQLIFCRSEHKDLNNYSSAISSKDFHIQLL